jgi:hypothetical protein
MDEHLWGSDRGGERERGGEEGYKPVGELILEVEDSGGGLRRMKGRSSRGTSGRLTVSAAVRDGGDGGADSSASLTILLPEGSSTSYHTNEKGT